MVVLKYQTLNELHYKFGSIYLNASFSNLVASVEEKRAVFLLLMTFNFVVLFEGVLLPLGAWERGYIVLLWHSLGLPYKYCVDIYIKNSRILKKIIGHKRFHIIYISNNYKNTSYVGSDAQYIFCPQKVGDI